MKKKTRSVLLGISGAAVLPLMAAEAPAAGPAQPVVSAVSMTQDAATRAVTVSYKLTGAPAIVTFDLLTNGPSGWASIGGERIQSITSDSAVWKKIAPSDTETRTITWIPDGAGLGTDNLKASVSAWALDNPPAYLVANLESAAEAGSERYYPAVDFLPGGLLTNPAYRTTKLVMRKIMATDVTWTMGTNEKGLNGGAHENEHEVTLTNNYYIGVFQLTQGQFKLASGWLKDDLPFRTDGAMRPLNSISYNEFRCAPLKTTAYHGGDWPGKPYEGSFLDLLNDRTGLSFDLPGEAQWEYACRAGHPPTQWGNGKAINKGTTNDPNMPGRHRYNGGFLNHGATEPEPSTVGSESGVGIVGSYEANSWGIYDMHGNVYELCLDWYESAIASLYGAVNIDPANPLQTAAGRVAGAQRVRRGGAFHVQTLDCRATNRLGADPAVREMHWGFRLAHHAGHALLDAPVSTGETEAAVSVAYGRQAEAATAELDARARSRMETEAIAFSSFPPQGLILIFK